MTPHYTTMHGSEPIPDLAQQPLAVDFIDTGRLDKFHPGFANPPSRYDPNTGDFIISCQPQTMSLASSGQLFAAHTPPVFSFISPNEEWDDLSDNVENELIPPRPLAQPATALEFWDLLFPRAMAHLREAHPKEPEALVGSKYDYRIRDMQDWDSVYGQLDDAKTKYCNVTRGFTANIRRVYRKFGEVVAEPLSGAAKFVPDLDIVTPVLGAVQILLEAAKNAAKVREDIVGGFDNVDMMFSKVELFLEIYKNDRNIEQASVKLISKTFHAIECVIGFFVSSTWKRAGAAVFSGKDGYQETITKSLKDIKDQSQILINETDDSEKYKNSEAWKQVLRRTRYWSSQLHQISNGQARLEQAAVRIEHMAKTRFNYLASEFVALRNAISRSPSPAPPSPALGPAPEWYVDPEELLAWIDMPDLTSEDLGEMEERRRILVPTHERARAEQLIQIGRVQEWIASPRSSQLLIHGNYSKKRVVSGLSLFCSSLFLSLSNQAPQIIRLAFFCGLHTDYLRDEFTGGRAMIGSFICQLLSQHDFSGRLEAGEIDQGLVESWDLEELCRLFEWLVSLLPGHIGVFCLVDGVHYYEREEFILDMSYVLVTILRISKDESTKAALKILVTSPTKTLDVRRPFPDDLIVSMDSLALPGMVSSKGRLGRSFAGALDGNSEANTPRWPVDMS